MKLIFMMYARVTNTENERHCIITPSLFASTVLVVVWDSIKILKHGGIGLEEGLRVVIVGLR
jgi:hypothetical protein